MAFGLIVLSESSLVHLGCLWSRGGHQGRQQSQAPETFLIPWAVCIHNFSRKPWLCQSSWYQIRTSAPGAWKPTLPPNSGHFPFCDSREYLGQGQGSDSLIPICLPPSNRAGSVLAHPNVGAGGSTVLGVTENCFSNWDATMGIGKLPT